MELPPHDPADAPQICYSMAYLVLPRHIRDEQQLLVDILSAKDGMGAGSLYAFTCQAYDVSPRDDLISSFRIHTGDLGEDHRYYIVEYPPPPPQDTSPMSKEDMLAAMRNPEAMTPPVLAPHFSALVVSRHTKEVEYFILGQSPDNRTTLRTATPEMNANLGPGCEAKIEAFVELLTRRMARE